MANWGNLTSQARATNLAVLLLAGVAVVSLLLNIRLWLGDSVSVLWCIARGGLVERVLMFRRFGSRRCFGDIS